MSKQILKPVPGPHPVADSPLTRTPEQIRDALSFALGPHSTRIERDLVAAVIDLTRLVEAPRCMRCRAACGPDDHCPGCDSYLCDACDRHLEPTGKHTVEQHG